MVSFAQSMPAPAPSRLRNASDLDELPRTQSGKPQKKILRGHFRRTVVDKMEDAGGEHHEKKTKKSLAHWSNFQTVSARQDQIRDWEEHSSVVIEAGSRFRKIIFEITSWVVPALVGFLTATCGYGIETGVNVMADWRLGYCATSLSPKEKCAEGGWVPWSAFSSSAYAADYVGFICVSVALAAVAALLCRYIAPTARGSGIPEVKTILGGFVMPDVLSFKTLCTKIVGLLFSVSSGLALGKEGPLVHVACCWANTLANFVPRYRKNETQRIALLSTAAAAGVSVAFGAPLGGVLFSLEEVSTMFPQKTMIRAFFASVVAAMSLRWYNPFGTGVLTAFEVAYTAPVAIGEYPAFIFLGVLGGLVGALFVTMNVQISTFRSSEAYKKRIPIVLEVSFIAFVTALMSFQNSFTKPLATPVIHSLFESCAGQQSSLGVHLCNDLEVDTGIYSVVLPLVMAALIRLTEQTLTFGTGCPAGLFVPCLYVGACLGRITGIGMFLLLGKQIEPGVYAMVGAAAVLGGVCRVTISLVVIMFELTGGLSYIVPFMCAVLVSKWVGDSLTAGIYDCYISIRGYPFLHEPADVTYTSRACDIMDEEIQYIFVTPTLISDALAEVEASEYGGFPLVRSAEDKTLIGYVHKEPYVEFLKDQCKKVNKDDTFAGFVQYYKDLVHAEIQRSPATEDCTVDVSAIIDATVMRVVPETPVSQIHNIFFQLGVKLVMVTRFGELVGLITKKSFLDHVHEGAHDKDDAIIFEAHPETKSSTGKVSCLAEPLLEDPGEV